MRFTLKETRLGLRNSTTRIPFRYGGACLTRCPQAILEATIEAGGRIQVGHAGDCFPPGWFDKTPGLGFDRQIADMIAAAELAVAALRDAAPSDVALFPAWFQAYEIVQKDALRRGVAPLLAGFGLSLVERSIMDALARAAGMSFGQAVRANLYAIDAGRVHPELKGLQPADWLPAEPRREVRVRHTVGLGDPLTAADLATEDRPADDDLPVTVEEYLQRTGLRDFKVKLGNQLDRDRQRLVDFARLVQSHRGPDYQLTLDGNEQYRMADDFDAFISMLETTPELATLRGNVLAVEQPLERTIALDYRHTAGIAALERWRPVIIDESDGTLTAYREALELGYRGVSSKACKGPIKSILNAGLTWLHNARGLDDNYLMTGEDLCSVGVVPVQSDLALVATLGLEHVERNGHHYHPGLSYLPESRRREALAAHPDFYVERGGRVAPDASTGRFQIGSIVDSPGFGFAAPPDMGDYTLADDWTYDSLGLS